MILNITQTCIFHFICLYTFTEFRNIRKNSVYYGILNLSFVEILNVARVFLPYPKTVVQSTDLRIFKFNFSLGHELYRKDENTI